MKKLLSKINNYSIVVHCLFFLLFFGHHKQIVSQNVEKPNVIFIFADDLGWGDLSVYGHPKLKTPSLDRLASEGRLFTQFYVNSAVCSPSRASFMTGRFPSELGLHGHLSTTKVNRRRGMPDFLDPNLPTVTRTFQRAGYKVGHFGKWHLGHTKNSPYPSEYGIDEAITNESNDTINLKLWNPQNRSKATQLVLEHSLNFINRNKHRPFYVNAWLVDPHAVLNPSSEQLSKFEWASPKPYSKKYYGEEVDFHGSTQVYYAVVSEMDRQIGLFLDELKKMGLEENTIVIFSSDNGPEVAEIPNASHSAAGNVGPFRGAKRSLYEGGVRVPFIVKWPLYIPKGSIDSTSVISGVDFMPTLANLCQIDLNDKLKLNGEDMSSSLLGTPQERNKPLFWEWRDKIFGRHIDKSPMLAIRFRNWKFLMNLDGTRKELYDIVKDPSELQNLSTIHSKLVNQLSQMIMEWREELPEGPISKEAGKNDYLLPK